MLHPSILNKNDQYTLLRCNVWFENIKKIEFYKTDEKCEFRMDSDDEDESK